MAKRWPGSISQTSYVYSRVLPRNPATKRTRDPTTAGGDVSHSTDRMFLYQAVALLGSAAKADTSARARSISTSLRTSTGISPDASASVRGEAAAGPSSEAHRRHVRASLWKYDVLAEAAPAIWTLDA